MASILPGFEYDIFISYRQKDNKGDHWVTEFVNALKTELESTFKEDISIYFDSNPHDGLLETHDVDDSLQDKLKCLIFIPILSQTYCDPKSFAWKNEFIAFKKLASEDILGLKVKLTNGNVASRILPVSIHELDASDKQLVETELGGPIRGIEFIFKSQGVVRPLKPVEADVKANLNHTVYHDQINKVARAIKELIVAIQSPGTSSGAGAILTSESVPAPSRKKLSLAASAFIVIAVLAYSLYYFTDMGSKLFRERDKSIAVLPFENMNRDSTQDYFSNGITEDILNNLAKISDLEVKSRTSTLQYKGTTKTAPVIGDELDVSNILEGSVRLVGDKVRVVVQLIDAQNDKHLWGETYDRDFKDILSLQSEIAVEIANALEIKLTSSEKEKIQKEITTDVTAYDYYLKARNSLNTTSSSKRNFTDIMELVNKAIELDPLFSPPYELKAQIWLRLKPFGLPQKVWVDSAFLNASKSIELDSQNSKGHLVHAII